MNAESLPLPAGWSPRTLSGLRKRLLDWFDGNRRDLPWRRDRDTYRIWISEVMLQQTTVAAVVPYFERFLESFPDVRALARAEEADVLKLWEGLGYYRRARHLHGTARAVVEEFGGTFPDDPTAWAKFPGVGRYILGAVLSQAFERRMPIVEANSLRVLARLFGYRDDPREGAGKAWVWRAAEKVLPKSRVGDFNQAMMELGALVCTPRNPACENCPFATACVANRDGLQHAIPPAKKPPVTVRIREVAITIQHGGNYLVGRRPADASRWSNLWEFPHGERRDGESLDDAAVRIAFELTGLTVNPVDEMGTVKHAVTRFAIEMSAVMASRSTGRVRSDFYAEMRWVSEAELTELPTSTPQRTLFRSLAEKRPRRLF